MSDYISQGSVRSGKALGDLGDEYRRLIAASQSENAYAAEADRNKHDNFLWSRVMSLRHFEVSGVYANNLVDDLAEAQAEIDAAMEVERKSWRLIFDPKEYELPNEVASVEAYHLPVMALEELGIEVTRLRSMVKQRVHAIKAVGDAGDIVEIPQAQTSE